jgi:glycosyltransferase involved in cell wall biosynthesis
MLVLADGQALQNPVTAHRGIGRYVSEFAAAVEHNHPGQIAGWVMRSDLPIPPRPAQIVRRGGFRVHDDPDLPRPDVWHVLSPFEALMSPVEQVWPTWARGSRTRLVVTLYDLIPLIYADRYLTDPAVRRAYFDRVSLIRGADRVLAISQASADDAIRLIGVHPRRITVVGTGVSEHFVPPADKAAATATARRAVRGLRAGYVMYTGGIDFRKNIDGLLLAYSKLPGRLRRRHQLVIVCRLLAHERRHLVDQATALGIESDLQLTGFVLDDVLLALYQGAHLFVFPSLYEGFGLPVVEALSCGVPAIVGSNSSLTELVPDPRAQFDARSADSISRALFAALTDERRRQDLISSARSRDYRWNVVAERSLAAYASARRRTLGALALPRIALISPMPPAPSGVADYSMEMLREFVGRVAVDVFTEPGADRTPLPGVRWFTYADFDSAAAVRGPYEQRLFAMGNSDQHIEALRILRRAGGTVLAHDANYRGLMRMVLKEHPELVDPASAQVLRSVDAGYRPDRHKDHVALDVVDYYSMNGLLTEPALQGARSILVNSTIASMLVRNNLPPSARAAVAVIPFGHSLREPSAPHRRDAVVSFGVVDRIKHSDLVCAAFIRLAHRHPDLTFALVGNVYDETLDRELAEMVGGAGLGDRLVLTGRVGRVDYSHWLDRARVAVQLRAWSNGECSAAIAEGLGAGIPVVASNTGAIAELADVTELLEEPMTVDRLVEAIDNLLGDPRRLAELARRGRAHAKANTFAAVAAAVLDTPAGSLDGPVTTTP